MSQKKISAGDLVDSQCTKCRMVTNHTVVAMVGDKVVRVQCNTCGGMHNYREAAPKKTAKPRTTTTKADAVPRQPRQRAATADLIFWEERCGEDATGSAKTYAMDGAYRADDLVSHPVFGIGIVTAVTPPNKVEILFRDGRKLLRGLPR
ncbi:MAG: hypothetical protein SCI25_05125 [Desulfuromonadales bacterium]|nr:hypothetical protein [Desulfuromonadales bacterium]MDW7757486.1 hypothetical protein [Desulfuromonadales bacterium]